MTDQLNILIAFPYARKKLLGLLEGYEGRVRWLCDSGAFTAWKTGKPISLDEYCKFLETVKPTPWRYFTLDVIGDPAGTVKNYETMLRRGFKPIPVFTFGEELQAIDYYYQTSDLIGCGGLADKFSTHAAAYLKAVWQKVNGRQVHLLGYTKMEWLKYFRPYSCDSSTWESAARYGAMDVYLGRGKVERIIRKEGKKPSQQAMRVIRNWGLDPWALSQEKNWRGGYSLARKIAAYTGVSISRDVEKHLGTKYFLANITDCGLEYCIEAHKKLSCT